MIARAFSDPQLDAAPGAADHARPCSPAPWSVVACRRPTPLSTSLGAPPITRSPHAGHGGDPEVVFKEAYEEGVRKAKATVDTIIERYHRAILELELLRDRVLVDSERDMVDLAVLVAREALGADPAGCAQFTLRMVEHALKTLRDADAITLKVSPTDYKAITTKHPEFLGTAAVVHIVEDPSIGLGGVVAECSFGRIDATLERRLAEAARKLQAELTPARLEGDAPTAGDPR